MFWRTSSQTIPTISSRSTCVRNFDSIRPSYQYPVVWKAHWSDEMLSALPDDFSQVLTSIERLSSTRKRVAN